jgi:hypothetical protein
VTGVVAAGGAVAGGASGTVSEPTAVSSAGLSPFAFAFGSGFGFGFTFVPTRTTFGSER